MQKVKLKNKLTIIYNKQPKKSDNNNVMSQAGFRDSLVKKTFTPGLTHSVTINKLISYYLNDLP